MKIWRSLVVALFSLGMAGPVLGAEKKCGTKVFLPDPEMKGVFFFALDKSERRSYVFGADAYSKKLALHPEFIQNIVRNASTVVAHNQEAYHLHEEVLLDTTPQSIAKTLDPELARFYRERVNLKYAKEGVSHALLDLAYFQMFDDMPPAVAMLFIQQTFAPDYYDLLTPEQIQEIPHLVAALTRELTLHQEILHAASQARIEDLESEEDIKNYLEQYHSYSHLESFLKIARQIAQSGASKLPISSLELRRLLRWAARMSRLHDERTNLLFVLPEAALEESYGFLHVLKQMGFTVTPVVSQAQWDFIHSSP